MIEKREINYAKEASDLGKFIYDLVNAVVKKEEFSILLPSLIEAINGLGDIDDEFREDPEAFINTLMVELHKIVYLFINK